MNLSKTITTLVLLGAFSTGAIAAELLTKEDLNKSPGLADARIGESVK